MIDIRHTPFVNPFHERDPLCLSDLKALKIFDTDKLRRIAKMPRRLLI